MPVKITMKVDAAAVREFTTGPSGPVYQYVESKATMVRDTSRRLCPQGSGKLSGSIDLTMTVAGQLVSAQVGSRLSYAVYVHEGTGIYGPRHSMIYPTHGKYLVFTPGGSSMGVPGEASGGGLGGGGGKVFAKAVRGVPASLYLYRAMLLELPGWPVQRIPLSG